MARVSLEEREEHQGDEKRTIQVRVAGYGLDGGGRRRGPDQSSSLPPLREVSRTSFDFDVVRPSIRPSSRSSRSFAVVAVLGWVNVGHTRHYHTASAERPRMSSTDSWEVEKDSRATSTHHPTQSAMSAWLGAHFFSNIPRSTRPHHHTTNLHLLLFPSLSSRPTANTFFRILDMPHATCHMAPAVAGYH
jgi:hypothetical protein